MAKVSAEVGSTANRYQILGRLAVGGMAEIFLARGANATGLERYCVLKRILRERAGDGQFVQMFLDEARLAAQLQHPNIASVYDIGMLGDSYFFTMEYVHGETVRSLIHRALGMNRPVPLACVLTIVAGAAAGLHHAHDRVSNDGRPLGIVHRDVSPSNLMVSYEGNVKIVDFGVAKAADRPVETKSGTVKGKISYLSPEQCRGTRVDRRSDLFSLGIVMWEMLTGARLYRRTSDFENMTAIVNEPPPPPSIQRAEVPRAIDDIVLRLLAKSMTDRFQTAGEVVEAIEHASMRAGTILSPSAVSRLIRDLFGTRPEPWLELDTDTLPFQRIMLASLPLPRQLGRVPLDPVERELAAVPDLSLSSVSEDELGDGSTSSEIDTVEPDPSAPARPTIPLAGQGPGRRAAGSIAPQNQPAAPRRAPSAPALPPVLPAAALRPPQSSAVPPQLPPSRAVPVPLPLSGSSPVPVAPAASAPSRPERAPSPSAMAPPPAAPSAPGSPAPPDPAPVGPSALLRALAGLPRAQTSQPSATTLLGVSAPASAPGATTIRTTSPIAIGPITATTPGTATASPSAVTAPDPALGPTLVTPPLSPTPTPTLVAPWPSVNATPASSFEALPHAPQAPMPGRPAERPVPPAAQPPGRPAERPVPPAGPAPATFAPPSGPAPATFAPPWPTPNPPVFTASNLPTTEWRSAGRRASRFTPRLITVMIIAAAIGAIAAWLSMRSDHRVPRVRIDPGGGMRTPDDAGSSATAPAATDSDAAAAPDPQPPETPAPASAADRKPSG